MGSALPEVDLGETAPIARIAVGMTHACAVLTDTSLKCWGENQAGELGLGDTNARGDQPGEMGDALPFVPLGRGVVDVALGAATTCGRLVSGHAVCWGDNTLGQLGRGDRTDVGSRPGEVSEELAALDLGGPVRALAVSGTRHVCALQGQDMICWGGNAFGQLGLGDTEARGDDAGELDASVAAIDLGNLGPITAIDAVGPMSCALSTAGEAKCFGGNLNGALGLGDGEARGDAAGEMGATLQSIDAGEPIAALAVGGAHACALSETGAVRCWGQNLSGVLGRGDGEHIGDMPGEMGAALAPLALPVTAVRTVHARGHACVVSEANEVVCWGANDVGQLGIGNTENQGDTPGELEALVTLEL